MLYVNVSSSDNQNNFHIVFALPRINQQDNFVGITAIICKRDYFEDFFSEFLGNLESSAMLIRGDGVILVQMLKHPDDFSARQLYSNFVREIGNHLDGGIYETNSKLNSSGDSQIISYEKVPDYPIYVAASLDKGTIVAVWKDDLLRELSIGGPLMLLLLSFGGAALYFTEREASVASSLHGGLSP